MVDISGIMDDLRQLEEMIEKLAREAGRSRIPSDIANKLEQTRADIRNL